MLRMMILQAARRPTYRYAAGLFILLSGLALVANGVGNGFLFFLAFVQPLMGFFNLYGADSAYYALWLGSGRSLRDWTLARQLFSLIYLGLFGGAGLAVGVWTGTMGAQRLPVYLPLFGEATLVALLVGPAVSRFVVTPQASEIVRAKTSGRSSRSYLSPFAVGATAVAVGTPGLLLIHLGWWPLNYAIFCALGATVAIARTYRRAWTHGFRERLATAFRA